VKASGTAATLPSGLRIFTVGHSFHANWLPAWLVDCAGAAGIQGHEQVGFLAVVAGKGMCR